MATRCTIKIEGVDYAKVYKHSDGYPEATLAWLKDFNEDFSKNRGDDATYKFAQLLRHSIRWGSMYDLDLSPYTGWGVVGFDEDWFQEYEYTLHKDGSVTYEE